MKKTEEGQQKVKIITRESTIELEKQSQNLVVKIDGEKVNDEEKLNEQGIEKSEYQVYVSQRGVQVRFDGQEIKIKISGMYKNMQCGLCGHYSDEQSDDFYTADGKRSQSLKAFQHSYTLKNEECDQQKLNKFDSQEYSFQPRKQQSAYYRNSFEQQNNDDSESQEEWLSSSEENKENTQQAKPVERTAVLEYAQKICFSMKPVKKCPQGTVADDSADTKSVKVQFFCLNRHSTEARRFQRQVRQNKIVESDSQKPSFFDNVEEPQKCQKAEFY
jgi:hypothetical protein